MVLPPHTHTSSFLSSPPALPPSLPPPFHTHRARACAHTRTHAQIRTTRPGIIFQTEEGWGRRVGTAGSGGGRAEEAQEGRRRRGGTAGGGREGGLIRRAPADRPARAVPTRSGFRAESAGRHSREGRRWRRGGRVEGALGQRGAGRGRIGRGLGWSIEARSSNAVINPSQWSAATAASLTAIIITKSLLQIM